MSARPCFQTAGPRTTWCTSGCRSSTGGPCRYPATSPCPAASSSGGTATTTVMSSPQQVTLHCGNIWSTIRSFRSLTCWFTYSLLDAISAIFICLTARLIVIVDWVVVHWRNSPRVLLCEVFWSLLWAERNFVTVLTGFAKFYQCTGGKFSLNVCGC